MAEDDGFLTNQPKVSSGKNIPLPPSRAAAFGSNGDVDNNQSSNESIVDDNISALKQKGYLHEKGFMGDRTLDNAAIAFNRAVNLGVNLSPLGRSISRTSYASTVVRDKRNRYFLYDNEKEFLAKKAAEFAAPGIIPYDVMEEFLYILVGVEEFDDLKYISDVVGIPELGDRNLIREPIPLLSVKDLYKVGYLANGVAAIVKQYDPKFDITQSSSYNSSPYYPVQSGLNFSQFPVTSIAVTLVQDIVKQVGLSTAITAGFSAFGSLTGLAKAAAVASLSTVTSQLSNLTSMLTSSISSIVSFGISAMNNVVNGLFSMVKKVRDLVNFISQISPVNILAATAAKIGDITTQMVKIATMGTSLGSIASTVLSLAKNIAGPLLSGQSLQTVLGRVGGYALNGILSELTTGQRLPTSVITRNPMMISPSYSGKAFFGEMLSPQAAVDQAFCKLISCFPDPTNGAGNVAFGMQNFGSFGGSLSVSSMISKIVYGISTPPTSGLIGSLISTATSNVTNLLGVSASTLIEPRRSDNSIPFLVSSAAGLINQSQSPFAFNTFYNSWKLASSVGNDVQRYQPQYLTVVRTSL